MIIQEKNDYLIQVKKNQKKLYEKIVTKFQEEITKQHQSPEIACSEEINKGRKEIRVCYKTDFTDPNWKGLKTAVLIQTLVKEKTKEKKTGKISWKESLTQKYFISSQTKDTKYYLDLKRSHWSIESFHYTKDTTFKEDNTKTNQGKSAQNRTYLNTLSYDIYKFTGSKNQAQSIRLFSGKILKLLEIIENFMLNI